MGNTAAQMTMAATVWFAKTRPDLAPEVSLKLANMLGEVAASEKWVAPGPDFDENASTKSMEEIQAFIDNSSELLTSVYRATGYPEELASVLSSAANFMGWKVPA